MGLHRHTFETSYKSITQSILTKSKTNMKNLQSESIELSFLTAEEMRSINGGFISRISLTFIRPVVRLFKFVVGEVTDFVEGVADGYNFVKP